MLALSEIIFPHVGDTFVAAFDTFVAAVVVTVVVAAVVTVVASLVVTVVVTVVVAVVVVHAFPFVPRCS